ncbi:tRNA (mnm(5)s(2)U34)-methyltransferase [Sporosarcina aquimarina]|uniref:Class I SAM-dependent methyltransferase n=1 Tax=Sporosarcina aquimarina TaxID=114975 RepID=A0ABU4G089_9BACL|nr:class I SAM-dependent methyltransferase [Sporosarcina aquimarina]MDW0110306.1 class I SAM-dependent methyltransferase [Sporosarcina aquimarina]
MRRILPHSKQLLTEMISEGDIVVDATMGNGNDTFFLAQAVGSSGKVYAFDIQQQALDATKERLGKLYSRTELILDSHARIKQYVPDGISAAVFNLGFLPNQNDHAVITKPDTTVQALKAALQLLKPGGVITVAVYDGHPGGPEERDAVLEFVQQLNAKLFQVVRYEVVNQQNHPPFLLIIEKTNRRAR